VGVVKSKTCTADGREKKYAEVRCGNMLRMWPLRRQKEMVKELAGLSWILGIYRVAQTSLGSRGNMLNIKCQVTFVVQCMYVGRPESKDTNAINFF
jgi:hypothetical protein